MESSVVRAEVHTQTDGSIVVDWTVEGKLTAVDIALGLTPDSIDHEHAVTVPAGQESCRLEVSVGARPFVSISPHGSGPAVVTADRRIPFAGITNFRDLGGYRSRLGGTVRWGRVFRADALAGLLPEDLKLYDQLGVRRVYDLRDDAERTERPNAMDSVHLEVLGRPAGTDPAPYAGAAMADGEQILGDLYKGLLDHAAVQTGRLLTGLLDDGGLPAVFHCHAGKDRTGVIAAVLLEALGVEREDVLDDYVLTARYRLRSQQESSLERLLESGLTPEAAAGVLTSPRWAMAEAINYLDDKYGGIDEYLTGPAGVAKENLRALRDRLVERRS